MEPSPRRSRRNRPISSAAMCCESAALPPFPHHSTLFPINKAPVISSAMRLRISCWDKIVWITSIWSEIARSKTSDGVNEDTVTPFQKWFYGTQSCPNFQFDLLGGREPSRLIDSYCQTACDRMSI